MTNITVDNKSLHYISVINLERFPFRREAKRTIKSLPINNILRHIVPTISFKRNHNGITLYWTKKIQSAQDSIEYYRIMVDNKEYGPRISPYDETKFQVNLEPGKHDCYVAVVPKDETQDTLKTNVLKIDGPREVKDSKQKKTSSFIPIQNALPQQDIPIPKLSLQTISSSAIRTNWYLDRPLPQDAYIAMYELHVRGMDFPEKMKSDESFENNGITEHVWYISKPPLEIEGISERIDYTVFVRGFFHMHGVTDIKYASSTSAELSTSRYNPLAELLIRPLLKVARASVVWSIDQSVDESLIKGYRLIVNGKPAEILAPTQHEYEFSNISPGTSYLLLYGIRYKRLFTLLIGSTNEIQVSVTSHPDWVDEKISEPVRIFCPKKPSQAKITAQQSTKPFGIAIKWQTVQTENDDIVSYKIFLDGKEREELPTNGRTSFKYEINDLKPDQTYSVYIKAVIGHKKLDGYVYQCQIESLPSNELSLKCSAPPKIPPPRLERMSPNGVDIVWDTPVEYGDAKLTGYQILKNGKAIGKQLPIEKNRASITDLEVGNRYSLQVVPLTDHPSGNAFRIGEEYDPERHFSVGPKLDIEYTDLVEIPKKIWIENITGHGAVVCWTPCNSLSSNVIPDHYKLYYWLQNETRNEATMLQVSKDVKSKELNELKSSTGYKILLEGWKRRRHNTTNDQYVVVTSSDPITFHTGSPPDPPTSFQVIACTNNAARISWDPFLEHNAEIVALRMDCIVVDETSQDNRHLTLELTPDSTEVILPNLAERTSYKVTVTAVTDEYLFENKIRDISQLSKKLKSDKWLPNKSLNLTTGGAEPATNLQFKIRNADSIQIDWTLPKAYGSTRLVGQCVRWMLENSDEHTLDVDPLTTSAVISGVLPSGFYTVNLDSIFSIKVNLESDDNNDSGRKEVRYSTSESSTLHFRTPAMCEKPELYLTGYSTKTIDLTWNKPNMFTIIDHPEKINEQVKLHRRLLGYRVDVNGEEKRALDDDQYQCTLTECLPNEEYKIQLYAKTTLQTEYLNDKLSSKNNSATDNEADETPSKKLRVRVLSEKDVLKSVHASFEFHHYVTNENTSEEKNEIKPLGKIHIRWSVTDTKNISHFILQWRSSKDLRTQQLTLGSTEKEHVLDSCDEKHFYSIDLIIVMNDGTRKQYDQLTMPIPGAPDSPKLWLVKTTDNNFIIEWSEPKSYGIPVIGFQLFIEGKKVGDIIEVNLRRAEIPSRINRTYQVNVCAVTDNPERALSALSRTLSVITTPTTNLMPTVYYDNDDNGGFDKTIARIIPVQIDSINEEKLHIDWSSFLSSKVVQAYYIQYTCLNNGDVQAIKVSKRHRHTVLKDLRPGFTYGIMVMAVDKNGGVLYTSDKTTIQMSAPPNAPWVTIRDRASDHVTIEWKPATSYGDLAVVGYKIFINNRLAAILSHDQLTYTLSNGTPCETYTVHVQALSNDKTITSPMSRSLEFTWPGIRPGVMRRIDDGQGGPVIMVWDDPKLEENDNLVAFKVFSENAATHEIRMHGDLDASTRQVQIHDLPNGKYRIWLEIQSSQYCVRARPLSVLIGRPSSMRHRRSSYDTAKCFMKKHKRYVVFDTELLFSDDRCKNFMPRMHLALLADAFGRIWDEASEMKLFQPDMFRCLLFLQSMTTLHKILFYDSKSYDETTFKKANEILHGKDKLHLTFLKSKLTEETVSEASGFDGICVFVNDTLHQTVLNELNKLNVKIIALRSAGFNNVHLETAEKHGIRVVRVPRYSPYAVAEHSIALLLALNRNMHKAFHRTKEHNFSLDGLVGVDLFGKTVGIIGTGGIGCIAINIFLGFGCKVLAHDIVPNLKYAAEKGFEYKSLDELLHESDIVSLYAPLLDSTYHLINKEAFDKMKKGAMLINTSRGGLVDSKALVDCLKSGKLRGAALDVYEFETNYFFNDYSQRVMEDDTLAR
ncbi:unnamed protein product, partial [Didymodactylos carnosus]